MGRSNYVSFGVSDNSIRNYIKLNSVTLGQITFNELVCLRNSCTTSLVSVISTKYINAFLHHKVKNNSCVIMQKQNAWHDVIIVKCTCIGTICQRNISFIVLLILSIWFFPKILVLKLLDRTGRKIVWTKWKRWICSTTFKWIQIKKTVVFAIIQS